MNMGDELGAATVHVATNIAQSTISTVANLIAEILKNIDIYMKNIEIFTL